MQISKKAKKEIRAFLLGSQLCGKRDLNPYGVNHTPLKRARLPVPPLPQMTGKILSTHTIIPPRDVFVNRYFQLFEKFFDNYNACGV